MTGQDKLKQIQAELNRLHDLNLLFDPSHGFLIGKPSKRYNRLLREYWAINRKIKRQKELYRKRKEAAREHIIGQLKTASNTPMTWGELADMQSDIERLGRRYGLLRELRREGII